MYNGDESLILDGAELPYSILDFWRTNLSELLLNVNRGSFAEFIVQCALTGGGFDALHQEKTGMEPWDIDGPDICIFGSVRPSRIEVKSCASLQHGMDDLAAPLDDTKLRFSIRKAVDWSNEPAGENRNNDLYVFCNYTALSKSDNILDMKYWDFYVCPTFRLNEDSFLKDRNAVSLWRLKRMGLEKCGFGSLYDRITGVLSEIEGFYCKETC